MNSKLKNLEKSILFGNHSDIEWIELNKEVDEALAHANEKEKQEFMDGGAGDLITQILEWIN